MDVSLEDSSQLTYARFVAQGHGVPYGELAAGTRPMPEISELDREVLGRIVDGSRVAPDIKTIIKTAKAEQVAAVFIDYVQLIEGCSGDHATLAEAMRLMQLAAKDDGIGYVVVSQVKQDVNYRANTRDGQGRLVGDPRPTINDTLGSSSIRTHSKLGLAIFYPWKYCKAPTSSTGPYRAYTNWVNNYPAGVEAAMNLYQSVIEIIVDKNVLGPSKVAVHATVDWPTGLVTPIDLGFNPLP